MLKNQIIFGAGLALAGSLWAQEPRVRTLETELPAIPEGVPAATYPLPRTDWVASFNNLLKESRKAAAGTRIVVDGDSIFAGWRRFWTAHFPNVPTFNFAIAGDRTQHLLWRMKQGQLEGFQPRAVLLMIGTNNIGNMESVEDTVAGIKAVVAGYRKRCPQATIYVHALLPRGGTEVWMEKVRKVNAGLISLNDETQVIVLDVSKAFLNEDGTIKKELMPDLLHPNEEGYGAWAEQLRPILSKYEFPANP